MSLRKKLVPNLSSKILREADLEGRIAALVAAIETPKAATLVKDIKLLFKRQPDQEWRSHIEAVVTTILKNRKGG